MADNITIKNSADIFGMFPGYDLKHAHSRYLNAEISAESGKDQFSAQTKPGKRKFSNKSIASSVLTAGFIGIIAAKGLNGSWAKKVSEQLMESGESSARHISYWFRKGLSKIMHCLESAANITPIKDVIFDKALLSNGITAKFAEGMRSGFKAAADKTLGRRYDKTGILINDAVSLLQKYSFENIMKLDAAQLNTPVTIKGQVKTLREWALILKHEAAGLAAAFNDGFSLGARKVRNAKREGFFKGLKDKIYNLYFQNGGLFKAENYRTYITSELTKDAHDALADEIIKAGRKITNDIQHVYARLKSMVSETQRLIKPGDSSSAKAFSEIKQQLKAFKMCSGALEAETREKICRNIIDQLNSIKSFITKGEYTREEKARILSRISDLTGSVSASGEDSKGALERIMTVLKGLNSAQIGNNGEKIISNSEFKEFQKLSKQISTGLNDAAELETEKYFIKQAEIEVGSAATDAAAVILPAGIGIYSMSKCRDKDERISSALRTCIPLAGAFGMCILGTVKMMSGGKNLALSLISGLVLNQLGTYADNFYRRYKKSGSAVKAAAGGYRNIISNFKARKGAENTGSKPVNIR